MIAEGGRRVEGCSGRNAEEESMEGRGVGRRGGGLRSIYSDRGDGWVGLVVVSPSHIMISFAQPIRTSTYYLCISNRSFCLGNEIEIGKCGALIDS